jgi:triacylglycerol lipase
MTCKVRVSQVVVGMVMGAALGCASVSDDDLLGTNDPTPDSPATGETPADDAVQPTQRTADKTGYTATRYPIVLAHGAAGFTSLLGVLEYFHGIPAELYGGGAEVYTTQVSALSSSDQRGEQLLAEVEYIVAATGAGKVNLIGHSQGGLDARYVAALRPDLVASVTTVGTPHRGSRIADWFLDHTAEGGFTRAVTDLLGDAFGLVLALLTGTDRPQDAIGSLEQLSSAGMSAFNARFPTGLPTTRCGEGPPAAGGIRFYSWSGASALTHALDPTDAAFAITTFLTGGDNDGLVERCSSHFGRVIRDDYRMNHLDEVNQSFGLTSWFETDPVSVYRQHANRLKNDGL